jgi:propanol-preferring alcohol dehydrogenase
VDVADPVAGPGEVVIETRVSALCGSELSAYRGKGMASGNGGHEAAGIVSELGPGVTSLRVGQRIGASAISGCGECEYCQRGQYTWCTDHAFYGNMHAERFVIPAHACHVLPDDVPWDAGVLISGDGLGVPYHTSTKLGNGEIDTVAVFGLGPIGLGNVLLETYLGRRVIGIDLKPERLALARTLGAVHTIDARETADAPEMVRAVTGAKGADVCIEAAGRPETARQCFQAVRTGGTVVFNGEQSSISLSPSEDFIRRDVTAFGAWYYHFGEFGDMLALYRSGLPVIRLITHRYPFTKAATAYREMAAGRTGKVLLEYGAE